MARIHKLPPDLANQIAAGEVVERPASVVKELVENALDAGARRMTITIEHGGKRLIRVEDDGVGMEPEDARLALERHATSKISRAEDLAAIETLGFRGEALPSIAAVSHFRLCTRARGRPTGTELRVNAGVTAAGHETGAPEGTLVEITDLFYNLPARRKFLKADAAESAQISRITTQLALASPSVGFTLVSGGRRLVECPPAHGFEERFFQLYGERPDLVAVRKDAGGVRLHGYVAALAEQGPVRGPQNVFVNRRIVRDRTIAHAIVEAYGSATIKERSPEVHLFVEIPPERVDVNVHPTKAEVRFVEQSLVHEVVRRALADALGQGPAPMLHFRMATLEPPAPIARTIPGVFADLSGASARPTRPAAVGSPSPSVSPSVEGTTGTTAQSPGGGADIEPMIPLGQFRDTFIIATDAEGLAIVDQHVAHERVLFEQIVERLGSGHLPSQRLLQPILLPLSVAQRQTLESRRTDLERFGFEVEEFGGDTLRVSAVPAMLGIEDAAAALRAVGEDLEGLDRNAPVESALKRIAATMACHAAVKANVSLTLEKMQYILDELRRTAYSTVCPHGRPVVLRLSRREIEKNFQRV